MLFIAYTFKGQVHVFAGRVKIVSHSSCRTSTILKYFCPLLILFCRLLTVFKTNFSKIILLGTLSVTNGLDPDQYQHYANPDLSSNCLQRLSVDDKSPLVRKELSYVVASGGEITSCIKIDKQ